MQAHVQTRTCPVTRARWGELWGNTLTEQTATPDETYRAIVMNTVPATSGVSTSLLGDSRVAFSAAAGVAGLVYNGGGAIFRVGATVSGSLFDDQNATAELFFAMTLNGAVVESSKTSITAPIDATSHLTEVVQVVVCATMPLSTGDAVELVVRTGATNATALYTLKSINLAILQANAAVS